jgi:large subunit ribosomal protein L23
MGIFAESKIKKEKKEAEKPAVLKAEPKSAGSAKAFNAAEANKRKLLIKQVWITEKSSDLSGSGKYVFVVEKSANKPEIKKAIESIYSVKVESVNVVNSKGKSKRLGRTMGKTSSYKKAIVSLKKGQKIDVMPS